MSVGDLDELLLEAADEETESLYPALAKSSLSYAIIAGQGEGSERCGNYYPTEFCTGGYMDSGGNEMCGRPRLVQHECRGRTCPDCWRQWRADAVESAVMRIVGFDFWAWLNGREEVESEDVPVDASLPRSEVVNETEYSDISEKRHVHAVVSFTKEEAEAHEFKDLRSKAAEAAKQAGYRGFMLIPHHYRIDPEIKHLLRERGLDDNGGFWLAVIRDELELGSWRKYVVPGLHFHVVGHTGVQFSGEEQLLPGDELDFEGVNFKRIRDVNSIDDLKATISYIATHATPPSNIGQNGAHWCTWYGDYAYNKFSHDPEKGYLTEKQNLHLRDICDYIYSEDDKPECPACGHVHYEPIWKATDYLRDHQCKIEFEQSLDIAFELMVETDLNVEPDYGDPHEVAEWLELEYSPPDDLND